MPSRSLRVGLLLAASALPSHVSAAEFVIVGPRPMGMGGAGVAVTTNALATYWNPAGLAMTQTVDIRAQGGGLAFDRLGLGDALHDLENFDTSDTSPANLAKAQSIADRVNQAGASVSVNGSAGLYLKGHLGEHAFGFNVSDVATGGGFVSTPVQVSQPGGAGTTISLGARWRYVASKPGSWRFRMPMPFSTKRFQSESPRKSFKAPPTMVRPISKEGAGSVRPIVSANQASLCPMALTSEQSIARPRG
ncbi:MAG: hypothetical protein P0120_05900 [Nitrospira sp.]|nr:hypothetical protein [Nitrospira sp.]